MESILEKLDDKAFAAWAAIRLCSGATLQVFLYDKNTIMSNASFRVERVENGYENAEVILFPRFVGNVVRYEVHSLAGQKLFCKTYDAPMCVQNGDDIRIEKGTLIMTME